MEVLARDWAFETVALPARSDSLDGLACGASARIRSVSGPAGTRRRLLEMGLCRGTVVEVVRRAPLGDPVELRVRGYLLSVRSEQARLIGVTAVDSAP